MKIKSKGLSIFFTFTILVLIMIFPDISKAGVSRGLVLSSTVIIPSLFPFMVCVMIFIKRGLNLKNKLINRILYKLFGHNFEMFFIFLLSMLGGYPVGAKLISEMYKQKQINEKAANIMLTYCVNAGPAFIISVVGSAFGSQKVGILLLISHLSTSIIIALISAKRIKKLNLEYKKSIKKSVDFSTCLIESVKDSTESILAICSFVILFSAIVSYFDYFFYNMTIIKNISLFFEVTSAIYKTKNIYLISFLLGFSGTSIWCQIFALLKNIKINIIRFSLGRILHGAISFLITKILFNIFKIKVSTFSNNISFKTEYLYSDITMFVSIGLMFVVLLIFIYTKNNSGKFIDNVI